MTISFVRLTSNSADSSATTITSTFAANGGGNLAVIGVYYVDGGTISVSSVTDDNGNTWTPAAAETYNATQGYSQRLYYAYNLVADAGTVTITATFSAATTFRRIHGAEYSSSHGAWTSDPLSTTGTGTGSGTALATGTITPAQSNAVICCAGSNPAGSISAGTGFTLRSPSGGGASTGFADHIQSALTAETAKLTSSGSGQWGITGATFLDAKFIAPSTVATTTTMPAVTAAGHVTITPATIATTTTMPAVTVVVGGVNITPATIATTTTLPAVTASGGATVAPAMIATTTAMSSVTVSTTNAPPFGMLIRVALGADPDSDLSLLTDDDWTDITDYVRHEQGVNIRAGRHGLGASTDPLQIRLRLDNRDGRFTPGLNTGAYWPYIRRMLPLQVRAAARDETTVELATAFIDTYELAWDESLNDCVVDVTANGRLWQISRRKVVTTAAGRSVITTDPVAYWPLTDGTTATQAASGLPGGAPMRKSGSIKFGTGEGLPGQPAILDLGALKNQVGSLTGPIPAGTSETSWRVEFQLNWASLTATDDAFGPNWSTAGTIAGWQFRYRHSDERIILRYTLAGSSTYTDLNTDVTEPYDGVTRVWRLTADQDGTGIDVVLTVNGVEKLNTTIASQTLGRPTEAKLRTSFAFNSGYDGSQAPAVGHYTFWAPYEAPSADTLLAATGYAGEEAADRVARLCEEAGIQVTVESGDSTPMGIQGDGTLLELLRECEAADDGILHDNGAAGSLVYIPRQHRYNRTADVEVDLDLRHLSPGFRPTFDGRDLVTSMEVSQPEGSSGSYMAESDEGSQPRSLTLNISDDEDPSQHAAWRVGRGMTPGMRYPRVEFDFRRSEDLLDMWLDRGGIDLRIDVTNLPQQQHSPLPVRQFAEGYEMRLNNHMWRVVLDCVPAEPYGVIVLTTSAASLVSAVSASATSWTSVVTEPPRWTTADLPLELTCGGEDPITATAIADVAITYVAAGTAAHADNASVTPGLPAGVTTGDLMLIVAAIRSSGTGTVSTPTGYTHMAGWHNLRLFGKIHDGSETDPTVSFSGGSAGDTTSAIMVAFRNTVDSATNCLVEWADFLNTSAQNITHPPLRTPKHDGCALLAIGWKQDDWTSVAALASWTEAFDISSTTGSDQGLVCDYQIQTTATAITSGSFTVTGGASAISRALLVAIAPGRSTLTVTRATNGTAISHSAGDTIQVSNPGRLAL